jgi:lactoylglutathione lyase
MIENVSHVGIRVADGPRAEAFWAKLGFSRVGSGEGGTVVILRNAGGVEVNLIVNADASFDGTNVLMDAPPKRAGYTHVAFGVASIEATVAKLAELGIPLSGGPQRLGDGVSLFIRDPDRNVIELRSSAT